VAAVAAGLADVEAEVASGLQKQSEVVAELDRDAREVSLRVDRALAAAAADSAAASSSAASLDPAASTSSSAGGGGGLSRSPPARKSSAGSVLALEACAALEDLQHHHQHACLPLMHDTGSAVHGAMGRCAAFKAGQGVLRTVVSLQRSVNRMNNKIRLVDEACSAPWSGSS